MWRVVLVCVVLGGVGCKKGPAAKRDAPSGVSPGTSGTTVLQSDDASTLVSPPLEDIPTQPQPPAANPGCTVVAKAISAWTLARAAYVGLAEEATRKGMTLNAFEQAVIDRVNQQAEATGGTGVAGSGITAATSPCTCESENVREQCQAYAQKGYPPVLCEATTAHEEVHKQQCIANRSLPASNPDHYNCDARQHSSQTPAQRARLEDRAYQANLKLVRDWYIAQKCPLPPIPSDACLVISDADAATALGRSIESTELSQIGVYSTCTYYGEGTGAPADRGSDLNMSSVAVSVLQTPVTRDVFEKKVIPGNTQSTGQPATRITDLGESAYSFGSGARSGSVIAFQKGVVVTVLVWIQHAETGSLQDEAEAAARTALARL